jgi:hypothetical protein
MPKTTNLAVVSSLWISLASAETGVSQRQVEEARNACQLSLGLSRSLEVARLAILPTDGPLKSVVFSRALDDRTQASAVLLMVLPGGRTLCELHNLSARQNSEFAESVAAAIRRELETTPDPFVVQLDGTRYVAELLTGRRTAIVSKSDANADDRTLTGFGRLRL